MAKRGPALEFEIWLHVAKNYLDVAKYKAGYGFAAAAEAAFAERMHPAKFAGKALAGAL